MFQRREWPQCLLVIAVLITCSALTILFWRVMEPDEQAVARAEAKPAAEAERVEEGLDLQADLPPEDPGGEVIGTGPGKRAARAETLVNELAAALEAADASRAAEILGPAALDADGGPIFSPMARTDPALGVEVREIGEIETNSRKRWEFTIHGGNGIAKKYWMDLAKVAQVWHIERVTSVGDGDVARMDLDPLATADAFLAAVLAQDFMEAREFLAEGAISDAKLAGLCILFEIGEYRLRATLPLRTVFVRGDRAGIIAQVESSSGGEAANFGINLGLPENPAAKAPWRVREVNLDSLLQDYSARITGGDGFNFPLVRNPAGGETIALYFAFDQDAIDPRTERQLEIVAQVLTSDPTRKLTLSGHTDAKGTEEYNRNLSARRALTVRNQLIQFGVGPAQIISSARGASEPRRPNFTESGEENAAGMRANRRTEIYLDFE